MIGQVTKVPEGFEGVIYGKKAQQELSGLELKDQVTLEKQSTFSEFTLWQKDAWLDEKAYPISLMSYLECAKIIHA